MEKLTSKGSYLNELVNSLTWAVLKERNLGASLISLQMSIYNYSRINSPPFCIPYHSTRKSPK